MVLATLGTIDWAVVTVYMIAVMLVGILAAGRQKTTRDYFLGDRALPWWAVTLSIVATETSAVTYIGFPGSAYRGDWSLLQLVVGFFVGRFFLAFFFIRTFYRFDIVTVYGYLEHRFGNATRVIAAAIFMAGRVIGSGVRLYAACLALEVATGLDIEWAIVILGALGLGYTLFGGIRSVVWTDCILGITFIIGGVVTVFVLLGHIDGGLETLGAHPSYAEKFQVFHTALPRQASGLVDWTAFFSSAQSLWVGLLGGFVLTLATHGTDQDIVQRMLACPDAKQGSRSLMASAVIILPLAALFLAVGSLLWFVHQLVPATQPGEGYQVDHYFPLFIVEHIPAGVAGILLAGVFAAALSSLTSVLNALASTAISDFYRPFFKRDASEWHYVRVSRLLTVFFGVVLIAMAWFFIGSKDSVYKMALGVLTYFYGALLGVFLLGIFTSRGTTASTVPAMLVAVPVVLLLQLRAFVENPDLAPSLVGGWIEAFPGGWISALESYVPLLAWPLWIVVGTAVTFLIGLVGRPGIARRSG